MSEGLIKRGTTIRKTIGLTPGNDPSLKGAFIIKDELYYCNRSRVLLILESSPGNYHYLIVTGGDHHDFEGDVDSSDQELVMLAESDILHIAEDLHRYGAVSDEHYQLAIEQSERIRQEKEEEAKREAEFERARLAQIALKRKQEAIEWLASLSEREFESLRILGGIRGNKNEGELEY